MGVEPAHTRTTLDVAEHGALAAVSRLNLNAVLDRAPDVLAAAERAGIRFVIPGDSEWPTQLDDLGDEVPFGLWVRGAANLREIGLRSVALVGARAASDYGVRVTSILATDLAAQGWCVVSGGAYGIDAAAHRGCLAGAGATVVVLASAVDVAYPTSHDTLFERCAQQGVIISEAPPGEPARRWRFLDRNRVIAALSRGTVVVEAARRSGALSTARRAEDLGRVVMGVPGPVTSGASSGVHNLLRAGAALVTSAHEVVTELVPPGSIAPAEAPDSAMLAALSVSSPQSVENLAHLTGHHVSEVLAELTLLELSGLATRSEAGWRAKRVIR